MKGTPWELACNWYGADEIHRAILRRQNVPGEQPPIPTDVMSREFAEWMC